MDCGLLKRASNLAKARSLKTQRSSRQVEADAASEREWPVDAKDYDIVIELGKGAHAVVYYAHCLPFDEPVAIKKIDLDDNSNWDLTALRRETGLMRKFHHPNVLPLYTSFVTGRELWMVMPVMGQGSVRSIMKRKYPEGLDEVVIATIMYQVLLGLEYVHKNRGIHRDLKADNILLSGTGDACLADFGVASTRTRMVSRINMDMSVVMATTFVGTPCWMAPEVMKQEEGYNSSADIWSFGITLIELATGKPPLARVHPMRVLMDTIRNPPPALDTAGSGRDYSQALRELVDCCLQKDPEARPTASALLKHRFFRMARDPDFLVTHFLKDVRPITPEHETTGMAAAAVAAAKAPVDPAGAVADAAAPATSCSRSARGLGSFVSGGGPTGRLKSTWYFPAELPTYQESEGDREEEGPGEEGVATAAATAIILGPSITVEAGAAPKKAVADRQPQGNDSVTDSTAGDPDSSIPAAAGELNQGLPTAIAAAKAQAAGDHDAAADGQQQFGADGDLQEGPCMVEVQVLLMDSQKVPVKAEAPTPAVTAAGSEASPAAKGVKLLKELSLSMKALLVGAAASKLASSPTLGGPLSGPNTQDYGGMVTAEDYTMFATKPRLMRGRPE